MSDLLTQFTRFRAKLREFSRIIGVVLLHDMRTRYGSSYFGYLIAIGWPLAHLVIVSASYLIRVRIAPIGESPAVFVATGVMPYILCLYPARTMQMAITSNRQLLNIPLLRPLHLITCRCILAMLNSILVLAIFIGAVSLFDVEIMPIDLIEGSKAVAAAILLGVGLGFFNVVLYALLGAPWTIIFLGIIIGTYLTSGVYVPTQMMPETMREYVVYNPLLNIVEWLRSAYFLSYDMSLVNKPLIFAFAGGSFALGLIGERYLRGKFFSS